MSTLPTESAEHSTRNFYKALCLHVILRAYSNSIDSVHNSDVIDKILSLIDLEPPNEKNVN